jgi:chromate reductase, NAD(P)H dehydrogenase (quinone)
LWRRGRGTICRHDVTWKARLHEWKRLISILGVAGSLRCGSFNAAALRAARELVLDGVQINIFDISPIPLYIDDILLQGYLSPAAAFRERIRAADGVLIATPE